MQSLEAPNTSGQTRRIGEVLVAQGKATEGQVSEALEAHKTDPRNLGKIMVSKGFISEEDLAVALAVRLSVEYVALFEVEMDPEVLGIVEEDVLVQHSAVPLKIEQGRLVVARRPCVNRLKFSGV